MAAQGLLATNAIATTADTLVYTCPVSSSGSVTINICNVSGSAIKVRVALTAVVGAPSSSDYIVYQQYIANEEYLTIPGIVLDAGNSIYVKSDVGNAATTKVWGYID